MRTPLATRESISRGVRARAVRTTALRAIFGALILAFIAMPVLASESLRLDDRIACRAAIEQVYWQHRAWPASNTTAKPPLSEVLPAAQLRNDSERTIAISSALEHFWQRPVGAAQLRAELRRIFRDSRDPKRLDELVEALGSEGYRLGECLARPLLVERLARAFYADDERFGTGAQRVSFDDWLASVRGELAREIVSTPADWASWNASSANASRATVAGGGWSPTSALPEGVTGETTVWTGSEMIVWGGTWAGGRRDSGSRYDPATDNWTTTAAIGAASPRRAHTAVWSGTEMIVWGGCGQSSTFCELGTGARYNPIADSWTAMASSPIVLRQQHTAVWSGTQMIVWGGCRTGTMSHNNCEIELGEGGRYDPATDSWLLASTIDQPSPRTGQTAVWLGNSMIVWGGFPDSGATNTGARYDPVTDDWTPTSTTNAPAPRSVHTAVSTATQMIVWGGCDNVMCASGDIRLNDGGRYDPQADAWLPVNTANAPDARDEHTAVWSGSQMIVWGGRGADFAERNTGGRYDPALDSWLPTNTVGAPSARNLHRAVWTGTEMIVWARLDPQQRKSGGRYDPVSDTWVPTSVNDPRLPRAKHVTVWTGSEMLVWGGSVGGGLSGMGDRYDPATDSWAAMSDVGEPINREHGSAAVWTGIQMIVWGGQLGTSLFDTGARYNPTNNSWQSMNVANAPPERAYHVMLWTGSRMFVWGGSSAGNTGALYDPVSDSWTPTSVVAAPSSRSYVPGVWTGTRALVWGGSGSTGDVATGGSYDPATDTWTAINPVGAPAARHFHSSLWTGSRLLVWGGMQGNLDIGTYLASGGLYDPDTDVWTPTALLGAPSGRIWHAGVWTGTDLIIWGGCRNASVCGDGLHTGAHYDPAGGQWTDTPLQSAPSARDSHSGVWTGNALIVWGGVADSYGSNTTTGGVYSRDSGHLFVDGFEAGGF